MPKFDFYNNKLALVFGGSEGIGKSIAKLLLDSGADVTIVSRSENKLLNAKAELSITAKKISVKALDITQSDRVQEFAKEYLANKGSPDFLINCAGYARPGYLHELDLDQIKKMMGLNYFGTVHTCKSFLPAMIESKKGHILNTSSIAGFIGLFGYTGYCGSKFAVIGFSEALRREVAPYGVSVSVLCPPNTKTPGLDLENKYKPAEVLATEEKVKVVEPDFVAEEALRALARGKFMIIPTFDGSMAHRLNRYLPHILEKFVRRPTLS